MGAPLVVELYAGDGAALPPPHTVDTLAEARGWINIASNEAMQCDVSRNGRLVARYRKQDGHWVLTILKTEGK